MTTWQELDEGLESEKIDMDKIISEACIQKPYIYISTSFRAINPTNQARLQGRVHAAPDSKIYATSDIKLALLVQTCGSKASMDVRSSVAQPIGVSQDD